MPKVRFPGARRCANCRFSALHHAGDLECRFNPPQIAYVGLDGAQTAFPRVAADVWCAKHAFAHPGPIVPKISTAAPSGGGA